MSDWNQHLQFIRQHFSVALFFSIIFATAMVHLWQENRNLQVDYRKLNAEIQAERNDMHEKELKFKDEKIQYEKEKSEFKIEIKEMQITVERTMEDTDKKMEELKQMLKIMENEPSLQEKNRRLTLIIGQYENAIKLLNEETSIEKKRNSTQGRIVKLMSDFSKLGVDLSLPDHCDKEYMKRYNEGVSIIDQIRALNESYLKDKEIYFFIGRNEKSGVVIYGDECEKISSLQ